MIRKTVLLVVPVLAIACSDNPVALGDLDTDVQFDLQAPRVETFQDIPVRITATESGVPMHMSNAQLEVRRGETGEVRIVRLEQHEGEYEAHIYFYEEGDYHLHMVGILDGHAIMAELGEHEVEVHQQRRFIGPYWVELRIATGPVLEDSTGHVHVQVYDIMPDDSRGPAVGGLDVHMAVHSPDDVETELVVVEEEVGEYETEIAFGHAGHYELHVEIEVDGVHQEGEFDIPVQTPEDLDGGNQDEDDGGNAHGH